MTSERCDSKSLGTERLRAWASVVILAGVLVTAGVLATRSPAARSSSACPDNPVRVLASGRASLTVAVGSRWVVRAAFCRRVVEEGGIVVHAVLPESQRWVHDPLGIEVTVSGLDAAGTSLRIEGTGSAFGANRPLRTAGELSWDPARDVRVGVVRLGDPCLGPGAGGVSSGGFDLAFGQEASGQVSIQGLCDEEWMTLCAFEYRMRTRSFDRSAELVESGIRLIRDPSLER